MGSPTVVLDTVPDILLVPGTAASQLSAKLCSGHLHFGGCSYSF